MKISSAQFYNSVRVEGRERQTVKSGADGVHNDTTLEFHNGLILIDSPLEPELIVVGMTNTRSFRADKSSSMELKQESFVFSRENSILTLESLKIEDVSECIRVDLADEAKPQEDQLTIENHEKVKTNDEPKPKKKGKNK